MSMEEVQKQKKISDATSSRVTNHLKIKNLPADVTEIFSFSEDKLVMVEYGMLVDKDDFEELCKTLERQANEFIPQEFLVETEIEEETMVWQDTDGNRVLLSFPTSDQKNQETVVLQLQMKK